MEELGIKPTWKPELSHQNQTSGSDERQQELYFTRLPWPSKTDLFIFSTDVSWNIYHVSDVTLDDWDTFLNKIDMVLSVWNLEPGSIVKQ